MSDVENSADLARRLHDAIDGVLPPTGVEYRVLQRVRPQLTHSTADARWRAVRTSLGSALVALAVVVITGGSIGIGLALRNQPHPSPAPAKPSPQSTLPIFPTKPPAESTPAPPTPWATPATVAYVAPTSVSFPDAADGWALGDACDLQQRCEASIARTTNGGGTWTLVSPPVDPREARLGLQVTAASGSDAWVWGTDSATGQAIFTATHDGGQSWHAVNVGGATVIDVAIASGTVWAETGCPQGPCSKQIRSSPVLGGAWTALAPLPAVVQAPVFSDAGVPGPELIRSTSRAWVLNANSDRPGLVRSDNGGRSWSALSLPCHAGASMLLAASSVSHVILACANTGGWPAPQEVWSSNDGGSHWLLRSREWFSFFSPPRPDVGRINSSGAPIGLIATSDSTAWMANDREDDLVTHDDGVTWAHAALPQNYFGGGGGAEGLAFGDPQHGWTFTSAGMWETSDGGAHWQYQPVIGRIPGF